MGLHDHYAATIYKPDEVLHYVPRYISAMCLLLISHDGITYVYEDASLVASKLLIKLQKPQNFSNTNGLQCIVKC